MESLLEQQRRYHEERERLVDAMVGETLVLKEGKVTQANVLTSGNNPGQTSLQAQRPMTHREKLHAEHRIRGMLDRYAESSDRLKEIYDDNDGQRKEEIQMLSGPNEFAEFYNRLKQIKDFHRRCPEESIQIPMSSEFEELKKIRETGGGAGNENSEIKDGIVLEFTDEEGYGKFLDLHECYEKYINLRGVDKVDYVTYLMVFDKLFDYPRERKNADYKNYLNTILAYFYDFMRRTRPLYDLKEEMSDVKREFEAKWADGEFPGWPSIELEKGSQSALSSYAGAHLDLSAFNSAEEVSTLGLDRLKSALMALGMKCGGTLEQRAERLFSTKGKQLNEIDPKLLAKSKVDKVADGRKELEKKKEIARMESEVYRFSELLSEHRSATKENVERKQARTETERDDEEEEMSEDDDVVENEEDDDIPYNPKNLPLGWDGKPIPYWLYKLHGLNISYNCEICGNFTYKGPKAFQRHFAEWRHAHGMRCLNIPNTAHFANVTQIEDALALWEKLKSQKSDEAWKPEQEEEFEDSQGNVVSRKIFEDLKRQGLL